MSCPGKVPQSTWRQNEIRIESSARSHLKTGEVMGVIGLEESLVSLTITIYLLMSVVYTSAPKARYRYRLEITSSSSARYFTRWFESRWCTDVEGFRFAITYDCGRTIQIGVFQLASRLAIERNRNVTIKIWLMVCL